MKKYFVIFLSIIGLGLFFRFYNLASFPIFGDEAIYIRWAQQMKDHPELRFVPLSDGKQPLFMWGIIPFLKVFENPLSAGRIVSVLTGLGTMIGVFVLSLILFGKDFRRPNLESKSGVQILKQIHNDSDAIKAALLAAFLYAISPFSIFFDRLALADSMLSMFGVWAVIFGLLTIILIRLDAAILTGFALGGALITKSPAVFFALLLPSLVIFRILKDKKIEFLDRNLYFIAPLFMISYIISYGIYNILRLGPDFHMLESRTFDYVYPYNHVISSPFDPLIPYLDRILEYFLILGPGIVLIFALFGAFKLLKINKAAFVVLLVWFLVPVLIVAAYSKTMTARYVYFSVPYLFIFSSTVVYYKNPLKKALYVGVFLTALLSFRWNWLYHNNLVELPLPQSERSGYLQEWTSGIGIQEVKNHIVSEANKDQEKEILVGTEGYFGTLPQGLEIYFHYKPQVEVIGVGINIEQTPEDLIAAKEVGKQVFLVINNERLDFDTSVVTGSDLSLHLVEEYPKAKREDGTVQKLQLYELK